VKADAYRNLHKGCISVRVKGRVQRCVQKLKLADVEFVVSQAGRRRVLREKRKNVHAVVRGTPASGAAPRGLCKVEVTYNPYKWGTFVTKKGKRPVKAAKFAVVRPGGVTIWRKCR
jgi:hypothetical protein